MLGFFLHGLFSFASIVQLPRVFASASSSNRQTLVLLCTMVRVKRRVGTAVFWSRKAAARLSACVAVVEVARLKQS